MNKRTIKKHWLVLVGFFLLLYMLFAVLKHPKPQLVNPALQAPVSPYKQSIAGIGIIEAQSENIAIGTSIPGIVTNIYVENGQKVKKDEPLFTIDSRDALARLASAKANLAYAVAALNDAKHKLQFYESIDDKRAISYEELVNRRDSVALNKARVAEMELTIKVIETEINRLTVRSPIDATILKLYIHLGEYAATGNFPLLILGNTDMMHVRVEIDESNAQDISSKSKAIGYLRGYNNQKISLKFLSIEPLFKAKQNISQEGNDLSDTRVVIVLYSFDNSQVNAHIGQQMDVYIDHE